MDKIKYPGEVERDFMKMFKMQIRLAAQDYDALELKFKIRFLCFFFCNYVDKILVLYYFGNFWEDVFIFQNFKTVQTK